MLVAGARLGGYQVLGPLGAGGMGEVYRARDTRLGRELLDFGLAKALQAEDSGEALSERPTATADTTGKGVALGTAPYMSPEQARGEALDRRTDVWAFGCVLYEMLSGRRAFPGPTYSEAIAAVLEREPDWEALPAATPPGIRKLLRRTLEKNKARRHWPRRAGGGRGS